MPPPSSLSIQTSSLLRLLKEESSYHAELSQQECRLQKLINGPTDSDEAENAEFMIRQQKQVIEETKAVFPELREKIKAQLEKLEAQLEAAKQNGSSASAEEITKGEEVATSGKAACGEVA